MIVGRGVVVNLWSSPEYECRRGQQNARRNSVWQACRDSRIPCLVNDTMRTGLETSVVTDHDDEL